ncbi:MAG: C40 family peptidase [Gallionella sp.]|nr:C40 family peptidase [Gallionella sp.]MDD4946004.1 C40 family peptidase [Gallionella sp.]
MKRFLALSILLLMSACSTTRHDTVSHTTTPSDESRMNSLAIYAMSLSDTPYRYGGADPENGFDCSGFVQFVFQNSVGMSLPRTSAEMSRVGIPMDISELRPGDLVFFNTRHSRFSHVGIFIGENRFVHSPKTGKAISIASLDDRYWRSHFDGARRIPINQKIVKNQ